MKALIYEAPKRLNFTDTAMPVAKYGECLVRIEASGICGSDMHAYLGHDARRPAPLILGHEAAGTVEQGGNVGQRVTINPLVSCGRCPCCKSGRDNLCPDRQIISMPPREGAFAQYVALPAANLIEVPDNVSMPMAALAEPMAVSWHAVKVGLSKFPNGIPKKVIILGGGAIGLTTCLALKAQGVENVLIVEPNADRRAFLETRCGVDAIEQCAGSADMVVDAVGLKATRASACEAVNPGGVIVHIGLAEDTGGLDVRRMTLQEITFVGTYTYTAFDFKESAQALFDGRLGPLDWMDVRPLSAGADAFRDILSGAAAAPKTILDPWN